MIRELPTVAAAVDQREQRRWALRLPVTVRTDGRVFDAEAHTRDFCIGGVFFYTRSTMEPERPIEMTLVLPRAIGLPHDQSFRCHGRTLRVHPMRNGQFGVAALVERYQPIPSDGASLAAPA